VAIASNLGEVEVALEKHNSIEQAVATVREDRPGLKRLIGYYLAKKEISTNDLRKHLGALIPDYMVPSAFVAVKEIPRTPSGKIDRKALPAPDVKRPDLDVAYAAPKSTVAKDPRQRVGRSARLSTKWVSMTTSSTSAAIRC
jgi:hypothetical protein